MEETNSILLALLGDAQKLGVDLSATKQRTVAPEVIFLAHKQVERQQNVTKAAARLQQMNDKKKEAVKDRVSQSVSEADAKARQKLLNTAADELKAKEDAEAATAKRPTRKAATPKE